ncbi:MAG: hypothetical protein A2731_01080 [Candidatus Buchananbacteria bacterium RIFCSPHIGHO2_01_FULL_39_8]|uniref:Major facilitator superfamily (MFS) profile domain-containing protein n=1 Tax=Candidatus Buchananbacteria bacterium RIFCSPHIGHO2_01_FULL_39_8 TaxID=1797533 RepID=A0A1G1Y302_9BACT|nr:MAG: hypothetical protein A2731_01080 [Candidatus Buchananbacteria bacterium RIFCSPHIGHO2_01_FULL_39_8]
MPLRKQKFNDSEILKFGFLGGIFEASYIFLVVSVMTILEKIMPSPANLVAGFMVLSLFVFSAAVSGILVFGYPAYLGFQKRYAEALMTAATSLLTMAIIGILVFILISIV